jgi:hypothetical protein
MWLPLPYGLHEIMDEQGLPYGLTHGMVGRTTWSVLPQGTGKTMEDQGLPDGILVHVVIIAIRLT